MRVFEAGDCRMARSYGTKGCAMRDPRGNPFMNPRSCQYRKLAQKKLAASEPARDDTVSGKQQNSPEREDPKQEPRPREGEECHG
ncbi:MAG: hypothetical protein VZR11_13330 [Succinimonas sp.]|nr:hypothetical protein [Succinimonas sp.]